jgi:predicted Fe-S protein YdhL (DUF1289 family)
MTRRGPSTVPIGPWVLGVVIVCFVSASAARAEQWQDYSPRERYEALQNYRRHRELPKKKQREIERQYQRWQEMSDDERQRIRKNYERYQRMPPNKRSAVEDRPRSAPPPPPRDRRR